MEHTFAAISIVGTAGVVLVVAAVVGGGFTLAGAEVPVISSVIRQVLVGVVGAALLALDLAYVGAEPDPSEPDDTNGAAARHHRLPLSVADVHPSDVHPSDVVS